MGRKLEGDLLHFILLLKWVSATIIHKKCETNPLPSPSNVLIAGKGKLCLKICGHMWISISTSTTDDIFFNNKIWEWFIPTPETFHFEKYFVFFPLIYQYPCLFHIIFIVYIVIIHAFFCKHTSCFSKGRI